MNEFKQKLLNYTDKYNDITYITKIGSNNVLITAPHTMQQTFLNGKIKYGEILTKEISMYIANITKSSYLIKNKDTNIDSNHVQKDDFKNILLDIIKDKNIQLVIDIHGAKKERDFDVELGNMNNLSSEFSTIRELKESFIENGIKNILINDPFKGGIILKKIYDETNIDVIQIEINGNYRDIDRIENVKKICDSLINFINQFNSRKDING